jgi:hypothetical protein
MSLRNNIAIEWTASVKKFGMRTGESYRFCPLVRHIASSIRTVAGQVLRNGSHPISHPLR